MASNSISKSNAAKRPERDFRAPNRLTVRYLSIEGLQLDSLNPRQHNDKQVQQIAESLRTFGFNVPILIDQHGKVIAGHGRVQACRLLGMTEVPTICLAHLSRDQARAFMIADNKLTENSTWNKSLLGEQLKALLEAEVDFDLEVTGFEVPEIDLLIEGLSAAPESGCDPADELPNEVEAQLTQPNDLWLLGRNRVLCGDSRDQQSYSSLMNGRRADMVITDPPYNVRIDGHATGLGMIRHRDFPMACGEMSDAGFTNFLSNVCNLLARYSHEGSIHFICMDWRHVRELLTAGREAYTELKNICVWTKDNAGTGRTCYGIELDPLYVDTIIRRWQRFTGMTAIHAVSGRKFNEVEQEATDESRR